MTRAIQNFSFLSLFLLSCSVWQLGKPQRQPTEDLDVDPSVSAAVVDELRPLLNEIQSDLRWLKRNMTTLSESVRNLTERVELHKNETASELDHLHASLVQFSSDSMPIESPTVAQAPSTHELLTSKLNSTVTEILESVKLECEEMLEMIVNSSAAIREACNASRCENHSSVTEFLTRLEEDVQQNFSLLLKNSYGYITSLPEHTCKGEGGWRRVFFLNMTDENSECPFGWTHFQSPKPTCGRSSETRLTCDSVSIRVSGAPYTKVCGSVKAYQVGPTDAFESYDEGTVTSIDGAYVSGVSLTHGNPREHIWTFAAGVRETHHTRNDACPCDASINITIPAFLNGSYFCESGHNTDTSAGVDYDDPLWDGEGCSASSTCCSLNNPPYFLHQLPAPTHDDIEARICHRDAGDDTPIEFMEVYVK